MSTMTKIHSITCAWITNTTDTDCTTMSTATNLFAPPSTGGLGPVEWKRENNKLILSQKPLVEFRAGKMDFNVSTNRVTPDTRKGLIQLIQVFETILSRDLHCQGPDGLIHFIWKDRTSGRVIDDLIIFPEEAVMKRVKQCTTGRVYLLEFRASSRKCFYWMQEPSEDKDEEYCSKINHYMNNPPSFGAEGGAEGGGN